MKITLSANLRISKISSKLQNTSKISFEGKTAKEIVDMVYKLLRKRITISLKSKQSIIKKATNCSQIILSSSISSLIILFVIPMTLFLIANLVFKTSIPG